MNLFISEVGRENMVDDLFSSGDAFFGRICKVAKISNVPRSDKGKKVLVWSV